MKLCNREGCNLPAKTRTGICMKHYKQDWYLKSVERTELIPRTSKGRWKSKLGYWMIKMEGELVYEHRVIMEKKLGKPIPDDCVVHHKNEDRSDNSLENLELMKKVDHARMHRELQWLRS